MDNVTKLVISVCAVATCLLTWGGYHCGADNLAVLLVIGGGVLLPFFGSHGNDTGALICFALAVVGLVFALTGAGFLAALALFFGAIAGCVGAAILINE
jgi:hypothetical protein